jgi:protein-S-isoprenylcysteine O-methyltransferase Ste14
MVRQRSDEMTWVDFIPSSMAGVLTFAAVALCALNYNIYDINWLLYLGWVVWAVGFIMCMTPMSVLRKRGGVSREDSWVKTTVVVESGPYAVVRHPIYVGWGVMVIALTLISQYWVVAVLVGVAVLLVYFDIRREDRDNFKKFGDSYIEYRRRVPQVNFAWGAVRWMWRRVRK